MREPHWARVDYGPIDYQDLYCYHAIEPTRTQSMLPNRGTTSLTFAKGRSDLKPCTHI
jgi:hypothetical protein